MHDNALKVRSQQHFEKLCARNGSVFCRTDFKALAILAKNNSSLNTTCRSTSQDDCSHNIAACKRQPNAISKLSQMGNDDNMWEQVKQFLNSLFVQCNKDTVRIPSGQDLQMLWICRWSVPLHLLKHSAFPQSHVRTCQNKSHMRVPKLNWLNLDLLPPPLPLPLLHQTWKGAQPAQPSATRKNYRKFFFHLFSFQFLQNQTNDYWSHVIPLRCLHWAKLILCHGEVELWGWAFPISPYIAYIWVSR